MKTEYCSNKFLSWCLVIISIIFLLITFYLGYSMFKVKKELKEIASTIYQTNEARTNIVVDIVHIKSNLNKINTQLKTNKFNVGDKVVYEGYKHMGKGYVRDVIFKEDDLSYDYVIAESMNIRVTKHYKTTFMKEYDDYRYFYENAEIIGEHNITSISEDCK